MRRMFKSPAKSDSSSDAIYRWADARTLTKQDATATRRRRQPFSIMMRDCGCIRGVGEARVGWVVLDPPFEGHLAGMVGRVRPTLRTPSVATPRRAASGICHRMLDAPRDCRRR